MSPFSTPCYLSLLLPVLFQKHSVSPNLKDISGVTRSGTQFTSFRRSFSFQVREEDSWSPWWTHQIPLGTRLKFRGRFGGLDTGPTWSQRDTHFTWLLLPSVTKDVQRQVRRMSWVPGTLILTDDLTLHDHSTYDWGPREKPHRRGLCLCHPVPDFSK